MICPHCQKITQFRISGVCLDCKEKGLSVNKYPKKPIPRNNGLNEGKRDYNEYLQTSRWQYARDYLNAKRNGVRLSY